MFIWEFKHKLTPRPQNCLNSEVEFPTSIPALVKHCLSIHEQMQATDRIRDRTKPLQSTQISAFTCLSTKIYQVFVTNSHPNISFSCLFSSIIETITPTLQYSEEEQARLIKKGRCFSCKEKGYNTYDYSKKKKIAAISDSVSKDSNCQGKE